MATPECISILDNYGLFIFLILARFNADTQQSPSDFKIILRDKSPRMVQAWKESAFGTDDRYRNIVQVPMYVLWGEKDQCILWYVCVCAAS